MSKYGLTEQRYSQMMAFYKNNEDAVREVVEQWGADLCNKGYAEVQTTDNGVFEINKIDDVGAFMSDKAAAEKAAKDGVKLIPVDELPENLTRRHFGYIDTPENRRLLAEYCANYKLTNEEIYESIKQSQQ